MSTDGAPPAFFVPSASPERQEGYYAELAGFCGCPVPPLGERVYSIKFERDWEEWTATVGEPLRGVTMLRPRTPRRQAEKWRPRPVSDSAVVLAIFPGYPYMVATTGRIRHRSAWQNPFMAGQPTKVVLFAREPEGSTP